MSMSRRYEGRFELWGEGRYQIMAYGEDADRKERVHSGFVVPFSQEYLRFSSNPIVLGDIMDKTDGRLIRPEMTAEQVFGVERQARRSSTAQFELLLLLLVLLIPLDVAFRRVHLADNRRVLSLRKCLHGGQSLFRLLWRDNGDDPAFARKVKWIVTEHRTN